MDTSGFYKYENGHLLFAPDSVGGASFSLFRELKDTYVYPVEGWTWYDGLDSLVAVLRPVDADGYIAKLEKVHASELAAKDLIIAKLQPDYIEIKPPTVDERLQTTIDTSLTVDEKIKYADILSKFYAEISVEAAKLEPIGAEEPIIP